MKFFKKCLIVVVSLFVILATQPTNVFADPTTHYFVDLEIGDFIANGDTIKYSSEGGTISIFDENDFHQNQSSYTAEREYFVYDKWSTWTNYLGLAPVAYVDVYLDGVKQGDIYKVSSVEPFVIDEETNTLTIGANLSYTPVVPVGYFAKWTWKSNKAGYTEYQAYDIGYQGMVPLNNFVDGSDYILNINCKLYDSQELTSLSISGSVSVEKNTTATYYIHLIDQNGNEIKGDQGAISYVQVDSSGAVVTGGDTGTIAYNDGYSFSITPNTAGYLFYKFSLGDPEVTETVKIKVEEAEGNSIIENNEWPWATNFDDINETVTLNTGLIGTYDNITYQWQSSTTNDDAAFNSGDIGGATNSSYTPGSVTSGTWYRCKISYKVNSGDAPTDIYTKGVQILIADGIDIASYDLQSFIFVSNGKGAYTYDKTYGKFNVLGLWNGSWICTSYDNSWSIYMKKPGSTITANTSEASYEGETWTEIDSINTENVLQPNNIESIYVRFSNYDNSNVIFDVKFNEACDAAIYSDVAMGNDEYFGSNADNAAVKANLNGNSLGNIQMFASSNFADASYHTCSFVLTPILKSIHDGSTLNNVNTFTIDTYGNGGEYFLGGEYHLGEYECEDDPIYDDNPTTPGDDYDYDYNLLVFQHQDLIFDFCKGWWGHEDPFEDSPFVPKTFNGQRISTGIYGDDSVLATSWSNVNELSFMFGIGKAGEVPGVTFTDIEPEEGEEEHHHSGGNWIEVPNTSASIR